MKRILYLIVLCSLIGFSQQKSNTEISKEQNIYKYKIKEIQNKTKSLQTLLFWWLLIGLIPFINTLLYIATPFISFKFLKNKTHKIIIYILFGVELLAFISLISAIFLNL